MDISLLPKWLLPRLEAEYGELTLIRANVNLVYLSEDNLIIRVVPPGPDQRRLQVSHEALRSTSAPVALPLNTLPIFLGDYQVDLYERHRAATPEDAPAWARACSELAATEAEGLTGLHGGISETIKRYLTAIPGQVPASYRRELWRRAIPTLASLTQLTPRRGIVHGDSHLGNLVIDHQGRGLWIDLDTLHLGDPLEDLSWAEVYLRRMSGGDGSAWREFLAAHPAVNQQELDILISARELEVVLWTATRWVSKPELRSLLDDRMATLDNPDQPWMAI